MFIDSKKFSELREKAKNGDEKAIAILKAFRNDDPNTSSMLDDYFKPVEEQTVEVKDVDRDSMSKLDKFLFDNNVKEGDEDYDEYVAEFNRMMEEHPEKNEDSDSDDDEDDEYEDEDGEISVYDLIYDENEAIEGYDAFILQVINDVDMKQEKKSLILEKLNKIKNEEIEHIKILQEMSKDFDNKVYKGMSNGEDDDL